MANEYLQRTPTSTGNRRVWTWSGWVKFNQNKAQGLFGTLQSGGINGLSFEFGSNGEFTIYDYSGGVVWQKSGGNIRDLSSWYHILLSVNTTIAGISTTSSDDRVKLYINGILFTRFTTSNNPSINLNTLINTTSGIGPLTIGAYGSYGGGPLSGELTDVFFVDGQALTPDVFGFYKEGKGYISAGSTQATDFRPGQWVPKTPRVIKTEINRRGGFGVNGFYLPMNDSKNFGADFHCEPNSIIKLNEELPQPRVGVATTASVGLGYTDALRADPYAANLVLALPFVSSGLSSGFGDYAPSIKGSGSVKVATLNGNVAIANTAGYYGNAAFFDGNGDYLTIPSSSDFSFGTGDFTVEFWMKRLDTGNNVGLLDTRATNTDGNAWFIRFNAATTIQFVDNATQYLSLTHSSDWNHVAFVRKSSVLTGYINGVAAGITTNLTKNFTSSNFLLGGFTDVQASPNGYFGYIQDLRIYKGVAKYTGGFDVPKPYTPVGIATWRAVSDTTANNFATLNPLKKTTGIVTFSNGNLTSVGDRNVANYCTFSTVGFGTGRWYAEIRQDAKSGTAANVLGVVSINLTNSSGISSYQHYYYGYSLNANRVTNITPSTTTNPFQDAGGTYAYDNGDLISIAADITNSKVYFAKNGVWLHTGTTTFSTSGSYDTSISSGIEWSFGEPASGGSGYTNSWNFGQNPTFSGNTTAGTFTDSNGKGLFKYQPPSGFLALCEDNLPTPAISNPGQHFKTVLWTGDGNSGRSIVGVGFTPDLVWTKYRNVANNHHIFDSLRGPFLSLKSNTTDADQLLNTTFLTVNSDGFSLGSSGDVNASGGTYVAWCWRAGAGTTSTNTNGSITSVVSVNQDAGFSIVSWTSDATVSVKTMGHGLGKTPSFIIVKNRDLVDNWFVYHSSLPQPTTQYLHLNATNSIVSSAPTAVWSTSSTTLGIRQSSIATLSTQRCIAYCWAEIEGYSKFGSYVGTGATDGPFVYCGFKPAFVLIKNASSTYNWYIIDNARSSTNPVSQTLSPNLSTIEDTGWTTNSFCDFTSNGFKIRGSNLSINESGATYIFAAFAESPFSYSNAK